MATAVIRNMNHGQNLHVLPNNNCVIVSPTSGGQSQSPVMMHQHQNSHTYTHHMIQTQQHQQVTNLMHQQTTQLQQLQQQQQHIPQTHHHHQTHQLGKRPIAPAPPVDQNRVNSISSTITNSKRPKMNYSHMQYGTTQPPSVQRRNARERNRVKQVNNGFANLRQHIPTDVVQALTNGGRGASKKLSKVDTLRLAVEYIRRLQVLLDDGENDTASTSSSRLSQNSTGSYYPTSPMACGSIPPPPCSESSASPTPSYTSDNSSIGNTSLPMPTYKYEVFDPYNPEDEELLDCITWWQQQ